MADESAADDERIEQLTERIDELEAENERLRLDSFMPRFRTVEYARQSTRRKRIGPRGRR